MKTEDVTRLDSLIDVADRKITSARLYANSMQYQRCADQIKLAIEALQAAQELIGDKGEPA